MKTLLCSFFQMKKLQNEDLFRADFVMITGQLGISINKILVACFFFLSWQLGISTDKILVAFLSWQLGISIDKSLVAFFCKLVRVNDN